MQIKLWELRCRPGSREPDGAQPRYQTIDPAPGCKKNADGEADSNTYDSIRLFYRQPEGSLYIARKGVPGLKVWDVVAQRQRPAPASLSKEAGHVVAIDKTLSLLGDANGNGKIELSELVARVQDRVPRISAELQGIGRAQSAITTLRAPARRAPASGPQSSRFASRGEDFEIVPRLP
jgi:hypothetical protein